MSSFRVHPRGAATQGSEAQIRRTNSSPEGSQTRLLRWGLLQSESPVLGGRSVASGLGREPHGFKKPPVTGSKIAAAGLRHLAILKETEYWRLEVSLV